MVQLGGDGQEDQPYDDAAKKAEIENTLNEFYDGEDGREYMQFDDLVELLAKPPWNNTLPEVARPELAKLSQQRIEKRLEEKKKVVEEKKKAEEAKKEAEEKAKMEAEEKAKKEAEEKAKKEAEEKAELKAAVAPKAEVVGSA